MFQRFIEKTLESIPSQDLLPSQTVNRSRARQGTAGPTGERSSTSSNRPPIGPGTSAGHRPQAKKWNDKPGDNTTAPEEGGPDPELFSIEDNARNMGSVVGPGKSDTADTIATERRSTDSNTVDGKTDPVSSRALEERPVNGDSNTAERPREDILTDEMRTKLQRLERIDAKFQDLLRSYRIAHARVKEIAPFEAVLRENTPLTTIQEPSAFSEYLAQMQSQNSLVIQELQATTIARDKTKQEIAAVLETLEKVQSQKTQLEQEKIAIESAKITAEALVAKLEDDRDAAIKQHVAAEDRIVKLQAENTAAASKAQELAGAQAEAEARANTLQEENAITLSKAQKSTEAQAEAERKVTKAEDSLTKALSAQHKAEEERDAAKADAESARETSSRIAATASASATPIVAATPQIVVASVTPGGGKKNRKKKGKGGKPSGGSTPLTPVAAIALSPPLPVGPSPQVAILENQISELNVKVADLEAQRGEVVKRLKDQDNLQEEIETLRESLSDIGNDFVGIKDDLKRTRIEKSILQSSLDQTVLEKTTVEGEKASLTQRLEELEKEQVITQKLSEERFTSLTATLELNKKLEADISRLQEKLNALEVALKAAEQDRHAKQDEVKRLVTVEAEIRNQLTDARDKASGLTKRLGVASTQQAQLDDAKRRLTADLARSENEKRAILDVRDRLSDEVAGLRNRLQAVSARAEEFDLRANRTESELTATRAELATRMNEIEDERRLSTAREAETRELASQIREVRDRGESAEEEAETAHRMLAERTSEAETLRQLLERETAAGSARMTELRARAERADEDRERAAEEAVDLDRRRAREISELKDRLSKTEKESLKAKEAISTTDTTLVDLKEEILQTKERMDGLVREAEMERKVAEKLRDEVKQEADRTRAAEEETRILQKQVEDTELKVEELEQARTLLEDELRHSQTRSTPGPGQTLPALNISNPRSRPSISSPSLPTLGSTSNSSSFLHQQQHYVTHSRTPSISTSLSASTANPNAPSQAVSTAGQVSAQSSTADSTKYLKHVFLQFLHLRDRSQQLSLVPVLSTLLGFEPGDEQKLISAISSK